MTKLSQQEILDILQVDDAVHPLPPEIQDEMAIPTYLHTNPLIRWLFWKRYECITKIASFSKDMSVLEFGCGIGVYLPTLSSCAGTVYAIYLFPHHAMSLVKRMKLNVTFVADLSQIPVNHLDLIIAADVIEHLDNPSEYIKKFKSKLKPGGRIIISGPTENIFYKFGKMFAGFKKKGGYHHNNIYQITSLFRKHKMKVENIINLPFGIPPYLFKVIEFKQLNQVIAGFLRG